MRNRLMLCLLLLVALTSFGLASPTTAAGPDTFEMCDTLCCTSGAQCRQLSACGPGYYCQPGPLGSCRQCLPF